MGQDCMGQYKALFVRLQEMEVSIQLTPPGTPETRQE